MNRLILLTSKFKERMTIFKPPIRIQMNEYSENDPLTCIFLTFTALNMHVSFIFLRNKLINLCKLVRCHISEDSTLHSQRLYNLTQA
jgi:hypothetical protein